MLLSYIKTVFFICQGGMERLNKVKILLACLTFIAGDISRCFPKKATYKVGQKANFTCPRPCDVTGDSIDFYVFDSDSGQSVSLFYYLKYDREDQLTSSYENDCAEGDSNGSVIASFVIGQQEANTSLTIYCTDSTSLSPCDSLIQPVLIHVEGVLLLYDCM